MAFFVPLDIFVLQVSALVRYAMVYTVKTMVMADTSTRNFSLSATTAGARNVRAQPCIYVQGFKFKLKMLTKTN